MGIERSEYLARQAAARRLSQTRLCVGLIAWARGASTQDHYAEVYYLTGFYTHYPFIPDEPGRWRARGHTAFVLPVDGPTTLIVDVARRQDPQPVADRVVFAEDVIAALVDAIIETVPASEVAFIGGEAMAWSWGRDLQDRLPHHRLVHAPDLATELRLVKSDGELDLLRTAGAVGTRAVVAAMEAAVPGTTEAEVAAAAIHEVVRAGGALYGLGLSSGPWAHTFSPSTPAAYSARKLVKGDMIRLDLYGSMEGYLFDFGRSRVVGQSPQHDQQEILDAVRSVVQAGTELLRPGETLAAVAKRCDEVFSELPYVRRAGTPRATMGGTWGHGLGLDWGAPWIEPTSAVVVQPGMCFALERRIEAPGIGGANFEDNIIVTAHGPEVITPAPDQYG